MRANMRGSASGPLLTLDRFRRKAFEFVNSLQARFQLALSKQRWIFDIAQCPLMR